MEMSQLQLNDLVLTMDPQSGRLQFSPVIMWLDRDEFGAELFVEITTKSGRKVRLTSSHLLYVADEAPASISTAPQSPTKEQEAHKVALVDLTNTTGQPEKKIQTIQEAIGGRKAGSRDNNLSENFYFYETASSGERAVDKSFETSPAQGQVSATQNALGQQQTLNINDFAVATYSRNAVVGQYLLTYSPNEQVELGGGLAKSTPSVPGASESAKPAHRRLDTNRIPFGRDSTINVQATPAHLRAEFDEITKIDFINREGIYAPLTREGNIVVNSVVASCYAVISDQDLAHLSFAPVRWFSYMHEWLFGLRPLVPTELRTVESIRINGDVVSQKNLLDIRRNDFQYVQARRSTPSHRLSALGALDSSALTDYQARAQKQVTQQHRRYIHWYPVLLYNIARFILPTGFMY